MFCLRSEWLIGCMVAWLAGTFVLPTQLDAQQNPATYQVYHLPETVRFMNGFFADTDNEIAYVVGSQDDESGSLIVGFVYDHFGTIDSTQPGKMYDVSDEDFGVEFPPPWAPDADACGFYDVNSDGRVVGVVIDGSGSFRACYLDLFPIDQNGNPIPRQLTEIVLPNSVPAKRAWDVNEMGDILVTTGDLPFIYNPETGEMIEIPVPAGTTRVRFNNIRQVAGDSSGVCFRHTITASPFTNDGSGVTEWFPEFSGTVGGYWYSKLINDSQEFYQTSEVEASQGNRGKPGSRIEERAVLVAADGSIEWQSSSDSSGRGINEAGDLLMEYYALEDPFDPQTPVLRHRQHGEHRIRDLVGYDDPLLNHAAIVWCALGERNQTGWPAIALCLDALDFDGTSVDSATILIPEPPRPGFVVYPLSGLVTSESGSTDSFEVSLRTQPTENVSIGIAIDANSENPAEGAVDKSTLEFTSANWNVAQTVTVTGLDDSLTDGDITYTIILSPASSNDASYNGLDPQDVTVTNLDDDTSGGGNGNGGGKGGGKK